MSGEGNERLTTEFRVRRGSEERPEGPERVRKGSRDSLERFERERVRRGFRESH